MVDSTRGIGPISGLTSNNRTQNPQSDKRTEEARSATPVDEVEISKEALDVIEAQRAAEEARAELTRDAGVSLSDSNFDGLV